MAAPACIALAAIVSPASAGATTTFTYQGRLDQNGAPVSGSVDLRFALFTDETTGQQSGRTITIDGVPIENGLVTVPLDFGEAALDAIAMSEGRWLQIDVRENGVGSFTTLSPRQPITVAPFAMSTRGLFVDDRNHVGIGANVTNFTSRLFVNGGVAARGGPPEFIGNGACGFTFATNGATPHAAGMFSFANNELQLLANNIAAIHIDDEGEIGFGTQTPDAHVHIVHGAVGGDWAILIENEVQNDGFLAGMRLSDNGFFDVTNVVEGGNFARLNSTGNWTVVSDARLKTGVEPLNDVLVRALQLRPVSYEFSAHPGERHIGFIAQDVRDVFPSLVTDGDDVLTLDYATLSVVAIAALQEQQLLMEEQAARMSVLEDENAALRARLDALESTVRNLAARLDHATR